MKLRKKYRNDLETVVLRCKTMVCVVEGAAWLEGGIKVRNNSMVEKGTEVY